MQRKNAPPSSAAQVHNTQKSTGSAKREKIRGWREWPPLGVVFEAGDLRFLGNVAKNKKQLKRELYEGEWERKKENLYRLSFYSPLAQ